MSHYTSSTGFFDLCWGILSAIGINNVLIALMVGAITGRFSIILLVPIVVSAACAVANGLCYYVFYTEYPVVNRTIACTFMDLAWLIQEAGLPFYSYAILFGILRGSERIVFLVLFWAFIFTAAVVRVCIIIFDARFILPINSSLDPNVAIINPLHIGYFVSVALAECLSSVFLLRIFRSTLQLEVLSEMSSRKLFRYLILSTQIRIATLALIGSARAITFSIHTIRDKEWNENGVVSQLDLFVYTLECFFPIIMLIDILASRLASAEQGSIGGGNAGTAN